MDFTGKLKKLLLLLIIPLTLSACSVSQNYQASANAKQFTTTEQLAVTIQRDIKQSPSYQKHHYQTKVYTRYINGLIQQVKEKRISEEDARNLLIKSYHQFKAGKYNFPEEKLMNEAPTPEEPTPHYIPPKPGAL